MVNRRTNRGQPIDMDALRAASSTKSRALGNMGVNAKGDELGTGGEVIKKKEDRVREYYKNNPKSSTAKASLKGDVPKNKVVADGLAPDVKTAKTAAENVRTSTVTTADVEKRTQEIKEEMVAPIEQDIAPIPPVEEPEEFGAPEGVEPLGYKEVELPNGDIEMVPYYNEEEKD